jgi:hypothetical protein
MTNHEKAADTTNELAILDEEADIRVSTMAGRPSPTAAHDSDQAQQLTHTVQNLTPLHRQGARSHRLHLP